MSLARNLLFSLFLLSIAGCQSLENKEFRIQNLAKSDVDMIIDQHILSVNLLTRELAIKLYKRNPRELAKAGPSVTVDLRLKQLLGTPRPINHAELNNLYGLEALTLAFDENYSGDRVFALMIAITGMLHASYEYRNEFFMLDEINQQKLYNSARNLEKIAWELRHKRNPEGELYILSDSMNDDIVNLSYERIFGKLIATQDMAAEIVAGSTDRTINRIVLSVATAPFLPI